MPQHQWGHPRQRQERVWRWACRQEPHLRATGWIREFSLTRFINICSLLQWLKFKTFATQERTSWLSSQQTLLIGRKRIGLCRESPSPSRADQWLGHFITVDWGAPSWFTRFLGAHAGSQVMTPGNSCSSSCSISHQAWPQRTEWPPG